MVGRMEGFLGASYRRSDFVEKLWHFLPARTVTDLRKSGWQRVFRCHSWFMLSATVWATGDF